MIIPEWRSFIERFKSTHRAWIERHPHGTLGELPAHVEKINVRGDDAGEYHGCDLGVL
ncbi:MAG: hypothetical protein WD066_07245 [Planctomycetaceae bacterium]